MKMYLLLLAAFTLAVNVADQKINVRGNVISYKLIYSGYKALVWVLSPNIYCSPIAQLIDGIGIFEFKDGILNYKSQYISVADFLYVDIYPGAGESTGSNYPLLNDASYLMEIWNSFIKQNSRYQTMPIYLLASGYGAMTASYLAKSGVFEGMILNNPLILPHFQQSISLIHDVQNEAMSYRDYLIQSYFGLVSNAVSLSTQDYGLLDKLGKLPSNNDSARNYTPTAIYTLEQIFKVKNATWNQCSSHYSQKDLSYLNALTEFNQTFYNTTNIYILGYNYGTRKLLDLLIYKYSSDFMFEEKPHMIDSKEVGKHYQIRNTTFLNTKYQWEIIVNEWIKQLIRNIHDIGIF